MPPSNVPISAIVVAQSNSDLAVVGHNGGEIFLTSNGTAAAAGVDEDRYRGHAEATRDAPGHRHDEGA